MRPTLSLLSLLFIAATSFGGWTSSGPVGGGMSAVVIAPSNPAVIWASNPAGVYRSIDGGATWADVSGPVTDAVYLAVHPTDPDKAWVLTNDPPWAPSTARVYRTADGGATWLVSNDGLAGVISSGLVIDPRNPDTLYAGSSCGPVGIDIWPNKAGGVFKSTDGGVTWKRTEPSLYSGCVYELAIDPFSPWRLFATGPFSGTQSESYDATRSWEPVGGARPSGGVLFDPRFPFTHYGISDRFSARFLVSQDGGFTWSVAAADNRLPGRALALSIDPKSGRLFLGTDKGVFRSGNGGTVWATTQAPNDAVNMLAFGGAPGSLFAATTRGLYEMMARGLGVPRDTGLHGVATNAKTLAIDPGDPKIVYAGVRPSGTVNGRYGSPFFTGAQFRTTNGGASWQPLPGDDGFKSEVISVDAAGTVYGWSFDSHAVHRRGRNDAKWTTLRASFDIDDIAADPKNAGTVFIASRSGVERSRDGGATWQTVIPQTLHRTSLTFDPSDSRTIYASNIFQLLRSTDGGDTWTDVIPPHSSETRALVVAPSNRDILYRVSAIPPGQLRPERSETRGATWHTIPLPASRYPDLLAVDPLDENTVWAAASGILYRSSDGGETWQNVDLPAPSSWLINAMTFDAEGRVLHVAFESHGVWELSIR